VKPWEGEVPKGNQRRRIPFSSQEIISLLELNVRISCPADRHWAKGNEEREMGDGKWEMGSER
jgi:hypothetical protein